MPAGLLADKLGGLASSNAQQLTEIYRDIQDACGAAVASMRPGLEGKGTCSWLASLPPARCRVQSSAQAAGSHYTYHVRLVYQHPCQYMAAQKATSACATARWTRAQLPSTPPTLISWPRCVRCWRTAAASRL